MRGSLYRWCLICVLLVSVPFQAWAASTGGCCWRAQAKSTQAASSAMASVDEMPCEHEIGVHALSISDTSAKTSADGALVQNHCKACTICSMGAVAPPPGPPHQNGSLESDTPTISPAGTFFSFIPPGIERPPKPLLYCPNGLR